MVFRQTGSGVRRRVGAKTKVSCLKTYSSSVVDEIAERRVHIPVYLCVSEEIF